MVIKKDGFNTCCSEIIDDSCGYDTKVKHCMKRTRISLGVVLILLCLVTAKGMDLCRNNNHVVGHWEQDNRTTKEYYCCGYDNLDHRHNIEKCGGITLGGLTEHWGSFRPQSGGHACNCDKREGRTTVNSRERYSWKPKNCEMLVWNSTNFCNLLGNRTVLFMGDSTIQQSAHSLMNMIQVSNGGCSEKIAVTRSRSYLFNDLSATILRLKPNILVINHGAHASDDGDIMSILSNMKREMENSALSEIKKKLRVVWRSNNPGHVSCDNYTSPDGYVFQTSSVANDWYHWSDFPRWDEMAYNFTLEMDWKFLNLSPLYGRADAHPAGGDCLHYCMPGPVDLSSILLHQMIQTGEL